MHVKGLDSHAIKALLASRALLVKVKRDLENHNLPIAENQSACLWIGTALGEAKPVIYRPALIHLLVFTGRLSAHLWSGALEMKLVYILAALLLLMSLMLLHDPIEEYAYGL